MLPQVGRLCLNATAAMLVAAGGALVAGCGAPDTPEARVRAVIAAGESAAEARDLGGLLELVSPEFRDEHGGGRDELKQYLRGYLVTHPSVHVLTRVEGVEFPYRDYARVQLTVGTLGRDGTSVSSADLAADVNDVALELRLEGDEWRVVRAAWRPTRRD